MNTDQTPQPEPNPEPVHENVGGCQQELVRRMFQDQTVYLYSVKLLRQSHNDPAEKIRFEEYYAATHIREVWAGIARELDDEAVEVESVTRCVPILAFLSPNSFIESRATFAGDMSRAT
jgi:hypothetical protein